MSALYKVCVTAAGRGTRVAASQGTNKALLPVGRRAVLSRILDRVPADVEVVIALGHEGQQIRDFLALTVPHRRVTFVEVPNYDGPGSGPGASLLRCREQLACPFILFACDTLVDNEVPPPDTDWIGVARVEGPAPYLIAEIVDGRVTRFFDKRAPEQLPAGMAAPYAAFIGLAGIRSHTQFWESLDREVRLVSGERQVAAGFEGLIAAGLATREFDWHDTGTDEALAAADAHYGPSAWLAKPGESLFFEGGRVVKYFQEASRAARRGERGKVLADVVPPHVAARGHFLAYDFVPGRIMSECVEECVFRRFVARARETVWAPVRLDDADTAAFSEASDRFYRVKTNERVRAFLERYPGSSDAVTVNGVAVPAVTQALTAVDWATLSDGTAPVRFHGDPQPENIVVAGDGRFVMLDWRDDFGGLTTCGDLYYDLAKVHHALIVSGEMIRANHFEVVASPGKVEVRLLVREHLLRFLGILEREVDQAGWDVNRMRLVSALTYLNIAPLHHAPYDRFLFSFGRLLLQQHRAGQWPY